MRAHHPSLVVFATSTDEDHRINFSKGFCLAAQNIRVPLVYTIDKERSRFMIAVVFDGPNPRVLYASYLLDQVKKKKINKLVGEQKKRRSCREVVRRLKVNKKKRARDGCLFAEKTFERLINF